MKSNGTLAALALVLALPTALGAADNLVLNPNLDYSDHNKKQGRLITGDNMGDGITKGVPNYIFFYREICYNSKRQARLTVHMYEKYKDRVHFVIVDLDKPLSPEQKLLRNWYFVGWFPHTTILDKQGKVVFDYTGDTVDDIVDGWLAYMLRQDGARP
jgi:hypothetical protein